MTKDELFIYHLETIIYNAKQTELITRDEILSALERVIEKFKGSNND